LSTYHCQDQPPMTRASCRLWPMSASTTSRNGRPGGVLLRRATTADTDVIGDVWIAAFNATYAFPAAHTDDQIRDWIGRDLLTGTETWVAEQDEDGVIGFMSLTDDMLDQLYIRPGSTGQGTGSLFVALAKTRRPGGLELYTFQANAGARRFYERHGFVAIAFGDGTGNDEHQPDIRYRWAPGP
jgi:GNAT superfamily N-acetyltransferase